MRPFTHNAMTIMRLPRGSALAVALLPFALACSDTTEPLPAAAATMAATTATTFTAVVGTKVDPLPSVIVKDASGKPAQNVEVTFTFSGTDGANTAVAPVRAMTGPDGTATTAWTLGTSAGVYRAIAEAAGLSRVVFTASAIPASPARVQRLGGSDLTGVVGSALAPFSVVVHDAFSNPVADVPVTFTVVTGGGSLDGAPATTNSAGVASSGIWTLGQTAGQQIAKAQAAGIAVEIVAIALPADVCGAACGASEQLAFVRGDQIYRANTDGTDVRMLTSDGRNADPAWSPDGRRIAFVSVRNGSRDIYIMDADGSNLLRRTVEGSNDSPAWSPDGRKIAFSSWRDGQYTIHVMNVEGDWSHPTRIGFDRGWNADPAWSPDGKKIAFTSDSRAYDFLYDLYVMDADGSNIKLIAEGPFFTVDGHEFFFQPAWAPKGGGIAAVVCPYAWDNCYPTSSIAVIGEGGSIRTLVSAGGLASPSWSSDGSTIAFSSTTCRTCAASIRYVTPDGNRTGLMIADGHSPAWRPRP